MTIRRAMAGDWGVVRMGTTNVPLRAALAVAGIIVWLVVAALLTGVENTFAAFAANGVFVAGLTLLATLTRTISLLTVVRAFALGALTMTIMLLLAQPLGGLARDPATAVDPIAEELLKLAPLALLMWQGRRVRIWQLGATDLLLIAVAGGAGFAVVEDAYIRMNDGWGDTLPFLPTTEILGDRIRGDRLIAGHAIWTALAGASLGIAWLMSRIRPFLLLAPVGFVFALADHIAVNSRTMPFLAPIVIVLFLVAAGGAIALDLYVLRQKLPPVPELEAALAAPASTTARWRRILESRRLRFAAWRLIRDPARSGGGAEQALRGSVSILLESRGA